MAKYALCVGSEPQAGPMALHVAPKRLAGGRGHGLGPTRQSRSRLSTGYSRDSGEGVCRINSRRTAV